jgi:protein phosphatase 1L
VSLTVLLAYITLVTAETMSYSNSAPSSPEEESIIHPESGGEKYPKFSYGYSSYKGKRFSMEDFHSTKIDTIEGKEVGLFGVFDGHGGSRAAEYLQKHLFENLLKHPKFLDDTKSVITEVYLETDKDFLKDEKNQNRDAGSTASTAVLVGDHLLVANVGDSRAVICKGGKAVALSTDHKPNQTGERQRIENAGGVVMWAGTWRVGGILAVSRAFGDRLLKQYVVADPEIQEDTIEKGVDFLVLASDGLWDVVSNEDAVEIVAKILNAEEADAEEAANKLTKEAYRRGSADNITCLIVRFNHNN